MVMAYAEARLHPMQDEQHKVMDEPSADEHASLVADDAVSKRSDDTALEEVQSGIGSIPDEPAATFEIAAAGNGSDAESKPAVEPQHEITGEAADELAGDDGEYAEDEDEEAEPDDPTTPAKPPILEELPDEEIRMDWYILKVQSNRERSIAEALERKIRIEGLDRFFDQVIVPTEKVTEFKGGKKKVVERKLYPGYIVVHMHINDDTWFAVRETSGVGDFTGAGGKPTPMLPHEVSRIIQTEEEETSEAPKLDIKFTSGDKVKVKEGNFENFEGEVSTIDEASGRVTVMINIFGRSTPVELEYWQIEAV
jgi:transcriptional antiterminator NusG